jgi:hypothetical protein
MIETETTLTVRKDKIPVSRAIINGLSPRLVGSTRINRYSMLGTGWTTPQSVAQVTSAAAAFHLTIMISYRTLLGELVVEQAQFLGTRTAGTPRAPVHNSLYPIRQANKTSGGGNRGVLSYLPDAPITFTYEPVSEPDGLVQVCIMYRGNDYMGVGVYQNCA